MKNNIKNTVIISTMMSTLLTTPVHADDEFIHINVDNSPKNVQIAPQDEEVEVLNNSNNELDIVLRVGEYKDKPGKRLILPNKAEGYNDLPIRYDATHDNWYICEYDFNVKIAKKLRWVLEQNGVNAILQDTTCKAEDLNAAGRIAKAKGVPIYLSVHTNAFNGKSSGYFLMTNEGDTKSAKIAERLSYSIKDNNLIPQLSNRINDGYIGEMNVKPGTYNILGEFGFFDNEVEAKKLASEEYCNYVARKMGDELTAILKDLGELEK